MRPSTPQVTTTVIALLAGTLLMASGAGADPGPPSTIHPFQAARTASPASSRLAGQVTIGSVAPSTLAGVCGGTASWTQKAVGAGVNSYVVPGAGVITSVTHFSTPQETGSYRAEFLGQGATDTARVYLAYTPLIAVTPGVTTTTPLRVAVPAGTSLGLYVPSGNIACNYGGGATETIGAGASADPSTVPGFDANLSFGNALMNLSAVWEPDGDGDGFGDVSQDACPQSKLTQAACPPPDTTVTKKPKKNSTKRKAKLTFSSTIAGSTFTCAVDGKAAKPCTSPFKKRFKYGKHNVVVTATSPFGIVDPTPVTVKFKVKKPKG